MTFSLLNIFKKKLTNKQKRVLKYNESLKKQQSLAKKKWTKKTKCCKFCAGRYWGKSQKCEMGLLPKCKESSCKNK